MTSPQKLKRLVTCQGSIQLVTALSVLNRREKEAATRGRACQDHLVIYDLYAPPGQVREFAGFIRHMAEEASNWESIVYVEPELIAQLASDLNERGPQPVFEQIYELLGERTVDEIYLSRKWQFGNQLFINAFKTAEKISYGDSIGIYFSESYFSPEARETGSAPNGFSLRGKLRSLKQSLLGSNTQPRSHTQRQNLKEVEFDVGYFLLPDILGESPPMKTRLIEKRDTLDVFESLKDLLEEKLSRLRNQLFGRPAVILMTSNFSEADRMSVDNELTAYVKYLEKLDRDGSVIVVKPHPRDSAGKIERLREQLRALGAEVVLLDDPELFFLPFEIVLKRVWAGEDGRISSDVRIVTLSTACLSLALLYDLEPLVGFGDDLVTEYFFAPYIPGRLRHERDLRRAIQRISAAEPAGHF